MYPPPKGQHESETQAEALDDTFLSSDPMGYFMSRIAMLHHWASCGPAPAPDDEIAEELSELGAVGRADVVAVMEAVFADARSPQLPTLVVSAQVAVDAFALRHHWPRRSCDCSSPASRTPKLQRVSRRRVCGPGSRTTASSTSGSSLTGHANCWTA